MFKKYLLVFLFIFCAKITSACYCNMPNLNLEFHSSKYVFYGEIISKTYPKDSLTYTFTFKIERHFKDGNHPKTLTFTWPSEARYRHEGFSDCDYDVNIGNKLLVFAQEKNGKLNFSLTCSNSTLDGLTIERMNTLLHAKQFNILNYHFNFDYTLFNNTVPLTNVDSLVKPFRNREFEKTEGVIIMFDVDTNGNVTKSNFWETNNIELNKPDSAISIFDIKNKEYRQPKNDFEVNVLAIAKQIKKWEVMRFKNSNESVNSRQYISFSLDKNNLIACKQFYFMLN